MSGLLRRLLPGASPPWDLPARQRGERYLVLVRHGEAAGGFGDDPDPGLSPAGHAQAAAMADALAPTGPLPIVVSPLRRTRETAAPLTARWGVEARIEPRVGEVVAPASAAGLPARAEWLRTALGASWPDLPDEVRAWRSSLLAALRAIPTDSVVVTHFVGINVAVGEATGDDRVMCFRPDHCSRTLLRVRGDELTLLSAGGTADTEVR